MTAFVEPRHIKIGLAGAAQNWPYAAYELGAGSTGGYFGGRLAEAGRDVTFLVRPRRAAQLQATGLNIVSPHGDVTLRPKLVTADAITAPYDAVLLAVKAYSLDAAIEDFAAAVGPRTAIIPTLNGMRHIDILAERFGEETVAGGVCKVAATIDPEGRILQFAAFQELAAKGTDRSHRGWRSLAPSCRAPVLRLGCLAQLDTRCGKNGRCLPRSVRSPARCAAISARSWPRRAARRLFSIFSMRSSAS
jgi:predicted dinucleotide-binding enzyme